MKKTNFLQQGGFPLETITLDKMQSAYFEILKAIIGHFALPNTGNYIIYGCEVVGNNITPGIMYIDGELCPFAGATGNASTKIAKIETIDDAPFENGNNLPTYYTYEALENNAGVALSSFIKVPKVSELVNQLPNWGDLQNVPAGLVFDPNYSATLQQIQTKITELEKKNAVFTAGGGMVLWNKPAALIPAGWQEVVDWKGRIPVGVDNTIVGGQFANPEFSPLTTGQNDPGRTGGNKARTLLVENLPPISFRLRGSGDDTNSTDGPLVNTNNKEENGGLWVTTGGTSVPFPILNPYRTVLFIEYIG